MEADDILVAFANPYFIPQTKYEIGVTSNAFLYHILGELPVLLYSSIVTSVTLEVIIK